MTAALFAPTAPTDPQLSLIAKREDDAEAERFEEMLYAAGWEDAAVPALADYEAPA